MPRPSAVPERRYAGLSANERRAGRRERLIEAANDHYGTTGYRSATIPQICRSAGVTARHFYEEFPSQEALLTAAYDRIASEMIERIKHALETHATRKPFESFRAGVEAYFTYVTSDKRRARIFALEVVGVGADLDRHRLAMRERFVTIAAANAARLGYAAGDLDARLLTLALVGVTDVLVLDWLVSRRRRSVAAMVDHVTTIWVRALQLERPKSRRTGLAVAARGSALPKRKRAT